MLGPPKGIRLAVMERGRAMAVRVMYKKDRGDSIVAFGGGTDTLNKQQQLQRIVQVKEGSEFRLEYRIQLQNDYEEVEMVEVWCRKGAAAFTRTSLFDRLCQGENDVRGNEGNSLDAWRRAPKGLLVRGAYELSVTLKDKENEPLLQFWFTFCFVKKYKQLLQEVQQQGRLVKGAV